MKKVTSLFNIDEPTFNIEVEHIINGNEVAIISENVKGFNCMAYQVIVNGGVELNTFEKQEAYKKFRKYSNSFIKKSFEDMGV